MAILKLLSPWGPVLFGIGFLAPVLAAFLTSFGVEGVFGLSNIVFGLIVGAVWGFIAKIGGRWI